MPGTRMPDGSIQAHISDGTLPLGVQAPSGALYVTIVGGNIDETLLADASVDLAGTKVTGVLPAANGGTGLTYGYRPNPQGRLTPTTGSPVITSPVSAGTSIYYEPYLGDLVPVYNGTGFSVVSIGAGCSQALNDSTKSPAAAAADTLYDMFVWSDSGTIRCTRGPAWSVNTAGSCSRGTGAGTTELERINGLLTNKVAITNGPAANRGTYVGTIRTNGSTQLAMTASGSGAGGIATFCDVWNMYNRVDWYATVADTTTSWTYGTTTWRSSNNSVANRCNFTIGLSEDVVWGAFSQVVENSAGAFGGISIGLNSTASPSGHSSRSGSPTVSIGVPAISQFNGRAVAGLNYLQALEYASAANATFYGFSGYGAPDGIAAHQLKIRVLC